MVVTKGSGAPTGVRTPVSALRGPRPRPLDDGGNEGHSTIWVFKRQQRGMLRGRPWREQKTPFSIHHNHHPSISRLVRIVNPAGVNSLR